ncbi:hypothetical protein ACFVJM_32495 [Streptomyces virginiae]|uniref:hypothetical protein n=1 Tax=Streptomyces virginiae TaxID=1961 RepID=UPI00363A0003
MRRFSRALGVAALAAACVATSATSAQAGTVVSGRGTKYGVCVNHVSMWTEGDGKVHAYAQQSCDRTVAIMRPTIALSGNNGRTFVTKGKACSRAKWCETDKVTLPATAAWTFRASNAGTATMSIPGKLDWNWPMNTVAHATKRMPF